MDVWDFLPLVGDPSEDERKKIMGEENSKSIDNARTVLENYKKLKGNA